MPLCDDPVDRRLDLLRHGAAARASSSATTSRRQIKDRPDVRRRVGGALVDALADLHAIDLDAAGLTHLGKPAGFVERQVRGWTDRWHRSKTSDAAGDGGAGDMAGASSCRPNPARPTIVHGDFKLDNLMLDARRPDAAGRPSSTGR